MRARISEMLAGRDWGEIIERAERIKEQCDDENLTDTQAQSAAYRELAPFMTAPGVGE